MEKKHGNSHRKIQVFPTIPVWLRNEINEERAREGLEFSAMVTILCNEALRARVWARAHVERVH